MPRGLVTGDVDHLVYAAPDLDEAVRRLEETLGVRAAPGGRHPQWGTRNALLSLGPETYLELVAPDPERASPNVPSVFGLSRLREPRLVGWAAREEHLRRRVAQAEGRGVRLGPVVEGNRTAPDGSELRWLLTDPEIVLGDGLVPFLIAWGASAHPARSAPHAGRLVKVRGEHPAPERVRAMLSALDLPLPVKAAPEPALVATIEVAGTRVELR